MYGMGGAVRNDMFGPAYVGLPQWEAAAGFHLYYYRPWHIPILGRSTLKDLLSLQKLNHEQKEDTRDL